MFGPKYRKALFVGIALSWIQQFSGINAVIFYSNNIFKGSTDPTQPVAPDVEETANLFTNILGVLNVLSAVTAGLIIDKAGRKSILLFGNFLCIVFLGILSYLVYHDNYAVSKYFVLLYIFAFGMSLGPVVWIYIAEILPDKGIAVAIFLNWVFTLIVGLCFPLVSDPKVLDSYGTFILFAACCLIGESFLASVVHETKGKN